MSFTPAITAESAMNRASAFWAISRASVVFPVPGGPQRIRECSCPDSMAWRRGLPGPSTCCCPTNSSSERGRMRSASGRNGSRAPTVTRAPDEPLDPARPSPETEIDKNHSRRNPHCVGDKVVDIRIAAPPHRALRDLNTTPEQQHRQGNQRVAAPAHQPTEPDAHAGEGQSVLGLVPQLHVRDIPCRLETGHSDEQHHAPSDNPPQAGKPQLRLRFHCFALL